MPIPIKPSNSESDSRLYVDYSFLSNMGLQSSFTPEPAPSKKVITASNREASALYSLWENGTRRDTGEFDIEKTLESAQLTPREITRLKTMGLITGDTEKVALTERGRKVLVTMTLNEPNNFQLRAQKKPYNAILASMDRTKKGGLRVPKYASNNSNCLNLKKMDK